MKTYVVALALSAALCAPAGADVLREAAEATVKCQAETDAEKRLACLEAASQQLQAALAAPVAVATASPPAPVSPAIVAPAPVAAEPPEADGTPFWAKAPERRVVDPDAEPEPTEIEVTVVKATESFGRYTFTTSDGQVWKQTQTDRVKLPKEMPAPATIKRKLTGNPMIQFTNVSRAYRVERIR